MAPAPPKGLLIGRNPSKPTHRIGKLIGSGVCSNVHELEALDGKSKEEYAIKIAPLPLKKSSSKAKPTPVERNANLIYYENVIYSNQLNKLRGKYVSSRVASAGPPEYGEVDGFRFLVLEKMEAPLADVVPRLIAGKKGRSGKISFGPIAVALVECLEAVHEISYLFVDVKPENFMLSSKGKTLASKIRMIDFGLAQNAGAIGGHRPNDGTSSMVGTPLYASLNVHEGQTYSRRDDLESVGYVIGELLIGLVTAAQGGNVGTAQLPWSEGNSDEHIGHLKRQELTSTKSTFFDSMGAGGNEKVERIMREYFQAVRAMGYKANPDYDGLKKLLSGLDVVIADTNGDKKPAARKTRNNKSTQTPSRAKRPSPDEKSSEDDEDVSPKIRRVIAIDDDEREPSVEDFATARETESMDWVPEPASDENKAPASTKPRRGVKIIFTEGPHKGQSFDLIKGHTDVIFLGKKPTAKGGTAFVLSCDEQAAETHAKLLLHSTKHVQSVKVTNLCSSETFVNQHPIQSRKDRQAFINDTISLGESVMKINPLPAVDTPAKQAAKMPAVVKMRDETLVSPLQEEPARNAPSSAASIRILFTQGPHKDESIVLQKGGVERIVLGSNPSTKSGEVYRLEGDGVDAKHVQLDLNVSRRLCTVIAKDLKSSNGTFVNSGRVKSGKDQKVFMNDHIKVGNHVMQIKPM